jgi:hypothetical protein
MGNNAGADVADSPVSTGWIRFVGERREEPPDRGSGTPQCTSGMLVGGRERQQ